MRPGIFVSRTREKLGRTCDQIGRTLEPCTTTNVIILMFNCLGKTEHAYISREILKGKIFMTLVDLHQFLSFCLKKNSLSVD